MLVKRNKKAWRGTKNLLRTIKKYINYFISKKEKKKKKKKN